MTTTLTLTRGQAAAVSVSLTTLALYAARPSLVLPLVDNEITRARRPLFGSMALPQDFDTVFDLLDAILAGGTPTMPPPEGDTLSFDSEPAELSSIFAALGGAGLTPHTEAQAEKYMMAEGGLFARYPNIVKGDAEDITRVAEKLVAVARTLAALGDVGPATDVPQN